MGGVKVLVLDDHGLVRESLALGLNGHHAIEVVGAHATIEGVEAAIGDIEADVIVADLDLGARRGTEVVGDISRRLGARVLLMSGTGDMRGVTAALDAGCSGFISKGRSLAEVIEAVLTVAQGGAVFPTEILGEVMNSGLRPGAALTAREFEVLQLLAKGRSAQDIADELYVSINTSRNHIATILTKLEARSQLEAVVRAARMGLVSVGWES